ncbi:hypothetical protein V6N13_002817 [Hibiscus sabdariffa]|uniref:Uncharacterized protein n=2 Tax=Hibiscus sabdariffa TaxID=183260 RepID=A0ABR2NYD8_9ROSI
MERGNTVTKQWWYSRTTTKSTCSIGMALEADFHIFQGQMVKSGLHSVTSQSANHGQHCSDEMNQLSMRPEGGEDSGVGKTLELDWANNKD